MPSRLHALLTAPKRMGAGIRRRLISENSGAGLADGDLVRGQGQDEIYLLSGGLRRLVPSMEVLEQIRGDGQEIRTVTLGILKTIPRGDVVGHMRHAATNKAAFERTVAPAAILEAPATEELYGRLAPEDLAAVRSRLTPEESRTLDECSNIDKMRFLLATGIHYEVLGVLAKTGLVPAAPPESVHAMGRGPLAAGGSYYYADLVMDALNAAGASVPNDSHALDFGCSSGRVVRVLAAAFPGVHWHGCDPNVPAIEWAASSLPAARFYAAPNDPPLSYPDAMFNAIFAVSIWSHFSEKAALSWMSEMERLIEPGGWLLFSAHGLQSLAHWADHGLRTVEELEEFRAALYRSGFHYKPEFGEEGDWGIVHPDWGTALFTPEWLLAKTATRWTVQFFAPGLAEGNQDVYVLRRRDFSPAAAHFSPAPASSESMFTTGRGGHHSIPAR
jgi:SAM-dependent methyltransferase